jgi:antibiotic biosynthesis monooxygenase (ABM) superfamily enzyme
MSALPPKADICTAQANVRFGPIADIALWLTATSRGGWRHRRD